MCIVVYKPAEADLPDYEILKRCFNKNPDGAGYMFARNDKVHIRKGYVNFDEFYEHLTRDYMTQDGVFVMHFRITTHGGTKPENTHPFPVSKNVLDLTMLDCYSNIGVAHNGILSISSKLAGQYSDTQMFITNYLALLLKNNPKYYEDEDTKHLINDMIGDTNRLAILSNDGHCELFGTFNEHDGCYYSNYGWEDIKTTTYDNSYFCDDYDLCTYADYWDKCYNSKTEEYDFDESFCPFSADNTSLFCFSCSNRHKCRYLKNNRR